MKILNHLIAFAFLLGISSMASAAVPPPPVNQNIGIPDTVFTFQNASVCNDCHGGNAPVGVPVNPGDNKDRHHMKVTEQQVIDGKPDWPPFRDGDGDGVNDTVFKCTNCHIITINPATGEQNIVNNYRNCLDCHKWAPGDTTVHHKTDKAQNGNCFLCHGGIVRGMNIDTLEGKKPDPLNPGQTVPVVTSTYDTTIITPWRSNKPNGDDRIVNSAGTSPGNCNFCHNTIDGLPGGETGGTPESFNLRDGTTATINIFTNIENHHGTGFANEGKCAWCHFELAGTVKDEIKSCQRCHDTPTLHNIEYDIDGNGTTAGHEQAYYGHIGNNDNCWGCHGNNGTVIGPNGELLDPVTLLPLENQSVASSGELPLSSQSANERLDAATSGVSSAIVPTLSTISEGSISEGTETVITLTGTSFVNTARLQNADGSWYNHTFTSNVMLTDKDGNATIIEPDTIDSTTITFTVPETMPLGYYSVIVNKAFQHTNPLGLVIKPVMQAEHAFVFTPYGPLVVLSGKGFTDSFEMYGVIGGETNIVDQNGNPPVVMYLWQDNLIIAHFDENPESVKVTNIFGEKTFTLDQY